MGSSHSAEQVPQEEDDEEEEEDEESHDGDNEEEEEEEPNRITQLVDINNNTRVVKKVLEQEPEMLPCYASASPLSPQLSSLGTPRLGPSIKVWDPYNVLAPPPPLPPPPPVFSRTFSSNSGVEEDRGGGEGFVEMFLISHGESELSLRPDLVGGRCPDAGLTGNGKRQARALAVLLNSHGVRFSAVFSSPVERARTMASLVCQEMNFAEEQIQSSDALTDMSQGHWEGLPSSEIYTSEILALMDRLQPDFSAPGGESLREVEFRMVQFLNITILGLPEKLRSELSFQSPNESHRFSHQNQHPLTNSIDEREGPSNPSPRWDLLQRHRQGLSRKKSGKSRLQFMTTTEEHDAEDEITPREPNHHQNGLHDSNLRASSSISSCIGLFTHSTPIRCLITGLLGSSPLMSQKICIADSSVTVLQHSWKTGWQIKCLNDTAHLRLL